MHQPTRHLAALAALAALTLAPALAAAQDTGAQDEQDAIEGPLKDQLEDYWSIDRDLDVLRDRLHTRAGRVHVGLTAGMLSSEPFLWYIPVGARVGYFLDDSFGIEVHGQFLLAQTTELTDFIASEREDNFEVATDANDRFIWRANAVATWHPLYGKLALLQRKLTHLDFNLVGGVGVSGVERPQPNRAGADVTVIPELVLGAGVSFYLYEGLTLRAEGRGYLGPNAEITTTEELRNRAPVQFPIEFVLGVTYAL
jgi:outer membrane beta-barrel protein